MADVWTLVDLLKTTADYLQNKGVDNPRLDAERLLSHLLEMDRVHLYLNFDRPMEAAELDAYRALVKRRAAREPLQYILGETEFWSLPMTVNPSVLIPRADTEVLVEEAIARLSDTASLLDAGAGSGAIGIALAHEKPGIDVTALDLSPAALKVVQCNAQRNDVAERVSLLEGDLCRLPAQRWDMIVSNPPYVPEDTYPTLMPEVRDFEPSLAVTIAGDGLACYRALATQAETALNPGGWLLVEVGVDQAKAVLQLFEQAGLTECFSRADYGGIERVVGGRRP